MGLLSFRLDNFVLGPSPEYHTYDSCLAQNTSEKVEPCQKRKLLIFVEIVEKWKPLKDGW